MTKHLIQLFTVLLIAAPAVFSQNNRSWVSSTGNDTNLCTRSSPCATFQGALAKTDSQGEIDVVDPGEYGTLNILQPVTIDGGGMARIFAFISDGVSVSTGSVYLRNVSITCTQRLSNGVSVGSPAKVHLENVSIQECAFGVFQSIGSTEITSSMIVDCAGGIIAGGGSVIVRNSAIDNISNAGIWTTSSSTAVVDGSLISNSGTAAQAGQPGNGGTPGNIILSNTTITGNTTGLAAFSGGAIVSFVNNRIYNNTTNGSPTSSVFQK